VAGEPVGAAAQGCAFFLAGGAPIVPSLSPAFEIAEKFGRPTRPAQMEFLWKKSW